MKDDSLGSEYLPFNFWYHGMNKIKAGKGYRNDIPLGPIGGKCSECDGDVISIKMNISAKGFETTSEKVCNKCGLVVPGAFQTLEAKAPYKSKYYATHDQWVDDQCREILNDDDIAWDAEAYSHATGKRLNTGGDDIDYGPNNEVTFPNRYDHNPRLALAIWRLKNTPASMKQPMQNWRLKQYMEIVDDYAHLLELLPYQVEDVKWIIEHDNSVTKWPYKIDDIIYNLCIVIGNKDLRKCNDYNGRLYTLLKERYLG